MFTTFSCAHGRSCRAGFQAGTFDPPFPNHTIMHGAGKLGLASLRNLDQLPATGAVVIAAPLKIVNGSGSPLRVLAIVES
jgi:isatin hydrolase